MLLLTKIKICSTLYKCVAKNSVLIKAFSCVKMSCDWINTKHPLTKPLIYSKFTQFLPSLQLL
jgi:hypothetical protein